MPARLNAPGPSSPASPHARRIADLCAWMDGLDRVPTLAELSLRAKLSPYHLQRTFREVMGVSPAQYARSRRAEVFRQTLRSSGSVTEAVYGSGFQSGSRAYDAGNTRLGMTPTEYRNHADGVPISYVSAHTSLGWMLLAATDRGLCFLQFGDSPAALQAQLAAEFPLARLEPMSSANERDFTLWISLLEQHLDGTSPSLDLPLDLRATAFRIRVWQYLQTIPYGTSQSYAEVAQNLGIPRAVRAVASACAANSVALVVPCHRVLRSNGALGGYRWGLDRKQRLLDAERSHAVPRKSRSLSPSSTQR